MINLEWYRTFKMVYQYRNYSKAAKALFMSQPAVSNQMNMLEAALGQKLFIRKSKGVAPTEHAKFLNNLVIESLDSLEGIAAKFGGIRGEKRTIHTLGISEHWYQRILAQHLPLIASNVSLYFERSSERLFELVNQQELDAAIVLEQVPTFDVLTQLLIESPLVIVGHPAVQTASFEEALSLNNHTLMQRWLEDQIWFSHNATNPHIKHFWLHCFNKKRPKIFTNYIIPNEHWMLEAMTVHQGIGIANLATAQAFLKQKRLKIIYQSSAFPKRSYYLIAHKKQQYFFQHLAELLANEEEL